ncbi:MAG: copper-translocating P-type ATPase [Spirochaetia bacterium]|nr:copper-translocating P-type ATPase [Spirochaetia bacterium]
MNNKHTAHDNNEGHNHHEMMVQDFKRRFFISLVLTIPILLLSPMIHSFLGVDWRFPGSSYILAALSTILFFYGGKPFLTGAKDELKEGSPAMMTLIAFAIIIAYTYSTAATFFIEGTDFYWELATLIVIMLLGHWIEMKSVMGASRALDELAKLLPEEAHLIQKDGTTKDIKISELKAGDKILVKPGEKIPIDGEIFEGTSEINEAMITGESVPVAKTQGDEIIGGSLNGDGLLKFKVSKIGDDTFLSQVKRLVQEAQSSKSKNQRLADTAAKWLFYIAASAGTITFIVWMFIRGDLAFSIERAVTVIIISCPHALGLAIPLVTSMSTSIAAKNGLLIRNRLAFEEARNVEKIVFDKTGTLTKGAFGVTDIHPIEGTEKELLTIAYSVESNSEHPIAQGIVRKGQELSLKVKKVSDYKSIPGKGLKATIAGKKIHVVSPGYMKAQKITFDEEIYEKLAKQGKTVVFVVEDNTLLGFIALADQLHDNAKKTISTIQSMGIETIMLTGDNQRVASYVGEQLGIDTVIAEVLPQDKSEKIKELMKDGKKVAMIGDGVNDAPSLAVADLGIAIGAGTDVAIETADIILVKSNPLDIVNLLKLAKATYSKIVQNLIWATAYNAIALPLAAGVLYSQGIVISPALGAALMSLSTIIVAINAKLLRIDT